MEEVLIYLFKSTSALSANNEYNDNSGLLKAGNIEEDIRRLRLAVSSHRRKTNGNKWRGSYFQMNLPKGGDLCYPTSLDTFVVQFYSRHSSLFPTFVNETKVA